MFGYTLIKTATLICERNAKQNAINSNKELMIVNKNLNCRINELKEQISSSIIRDKKTGRFQKSN